MKSHGMGNSVKKNTLFLSIGQIIQLMLAFLMVPFAARYLGEAGFGQYSLATAIMYIIFLVNDFGLNTLTTRENAREKARAGEVFGTVLFIKLAFVLACALVLLLALWIYDLPRQAAMATAIFAVFGILTSIGQLATGVFRSFERMEYETVVVILEKAVITGLGILFLVQGANLVQFSLVFVAGGLTTVAVSFFVIRKKFFPITIRFDLRHAREILRESAVFGLSLFLITAYVRTSILLLGAMKSEEVVGWYSAAYRLISLTSVVPTIFVSATFPKLSRESLVRREVVALLFTKGFKYLIFLALPIVAGTTVLADKIIYLVYGAAYVQAIPTLKILALTAAFSFMNIYLAGLFGATNHQKQMFYLQAAVLVTSVALNLLWIPDHNHIGAAWASVATEGLMFILALYIAVTKITRLCEKMFFLKALAATLVMTAGLLLMPHINVFLSIISATLIYFASLFLLRGFTLEELLGFNRENQAQAS